MAYPFKLIAQMREERDALLAERDQLRAERDSHQRLCIAEMEKNAQLRAEVAMLRSYESEWERSLNQLRAELEAIRGQRDVPLHAAVNHACGELPEGWSIEVGAERGGAWVALYNAEMEEVEFPTDNERLDYTVKDAVEFALLSTKNAEEGE